MGASKRRRRPSGNKRSGSPPDHADDPPHHLPFGHHQEDSDGESPHNSLQDAFEHFFAGLGDVLGRPDEDDDDRG
ncbi:MAG TPA: hypothetical protein VGV88_09205 [Candidatus Dormibacteraeota bacterium]|nr:hypothetical protein [Candidatus Dormibacteraeota bacterium]